MYTNGSESARFPHTVQLEAATDRDVEAAYLWGACEP